MQAKEKSVERVVLAGFMGSGKTTVGRLLAERLGWAFVDLDHVIEGEQRRSVPQIFAESGEAAFRALEAMSLAALLQRERVVIALGGGALDTESNRNVLQEAAGTVVVHLKAPFAVLVERCRAQEDATERPVLADLRVAEERFMRRSAWFAAVAHYGLETTGMDEAATVKAVTDLLAGHAFSHFAS